MSSTKSQCAFCSQLREGLYVCPRCKSNYCSVRCYRSEKHRHCSEGFYKQCVETALKNTRCDNKESVKKPQTFEEFMQKCQATGCETSQSNQEEQGEPLDSDDEDLEYLDKISKTTADQFEKTDESEIERRLTAMGIGTEPEQLYAALDDCEKAAFVELAEQLQYKESGFGDSVFRKK